MRLEDYEEIEEERRHRKAVRVACGRRIGRKLRERKKKHDKRYRYARKDKNARKVTSNSNGRHILRR
jgi:hypothetical protein